MPVTIPTHLQLMNPLLQAMHSLGGSGSVKEIYDNDTEVAYRLAWARTSLKKYGLLANSVRGVWSLTAKAKDTKQIDPEEVVKYVKALSKDAGAQENIEASPPAELSEDQWKLANPRIEELPRSFPMQTL